MRNIDRVRELEAQNRSLKSRLDAALTSESKFAVEAHRWKDIANKEHQRVEEARTARDKAFDAVMQVEQAASSLLAEASILCGEEDGDGYALHLPCPDTAEMLRIWEVHTAPTADGEYIVRATPRKETDNAAHDSAGVPADAGTGADAPEVPERQDDR